MTLFPSLRGMSVIGIDTETTGLTYQDRPVGCSIWTETGEGRYFAWGHRDGGNNCGLADFIRWANEELTRPGLTLAMLNPLFDMRMLASVGVKIFKTHCEGADTVCALLNEYETSYSLEGLAQTYTPHALKDSRALDEYCAKRYGGAVSHNQQAPHYWWAPGDVVADYAIGDARATYELYTARRPLIDQPDRDGNTQSHIYQVETDLLPVLVRMYQVGTKIDVPEARRVKAVLEAEYQQAKVEWDRLSGGFRFSERNKMVELFDRLGIQYPRHEPTAAMRARGITQGNPQMDKYFLDELDHPIGALIRRMRQLTHYSDTFIQGYLLDNLDPTDHIHPNFWPTRSDRGGTITGRFSSSGGLNAQNIPARDEEWAPLVRGMFIPTSPEHQWLKCDYCLVGDTLVETLQGPVPIRDVRPGDKVYAWKDGQITWDTVKRQACVGELLAYRVTLDNGESFLASGDHGMVLRDGGRVDVKDLTPGTSLAAIRFTETGAYRSVYSVRLHEAVPVHHLVAEAFLGPRPEGHDIHHKDGQKWRNSPDNLEYLPVGVHRSGHAWSGVDEEKRRRCSPCAAKMKPGPVINLNHKVVKVEMLGLVLPMYHLEMEGEGHNFALSCGVISRNSQIEYRFFAHYAGGQMRKAYQENPHVDFHQFVMDLTDLKRKPAKNVNFAKLYGAGIAKLAKTIGCNEDEARRIVRTYDVKIPEAKAISTRAMNRASVRGYIVTWGGRILRFKRRGRGYEKTHTALNKLLQGSSANLTKEAMIRVGQEIDWDDTRLHLTVHDELDLSVPLGAAGATVGRQIKALMEDFKLTVPIIAEAELGPDWGHCEALEEVP